MHLRGLLKTDADDIFEYSKLPEVTGMVGMRLHNTIEVTYKYIEYEIKKCETYALVTKENHKMIGTESLRKISNESELDIRSISCVINPEYLGRGYAPEAIKVLVKHSFDNLKVHKIIGGHYSFNSQSASVNKKLGLYMKVQIEKYEYTKGN